MSEVNSTILTTRFQNLEGQKFGKLTVLSFAGITFSSRGRKVAHWRCLCSCGRERVANTPNLTRGDVVSCGCAKRGVKPHSDIRGTSGKPSPEYRTWSRMFARCYNPKTSSHANYGGRGITVCERWKDFATFLADMGPRPTPLHQIDRFPNNDGNYEPGNCRWATKSQQMRNTRMTIFLTHNGETLCLSEWAERIGISQDTLRRRKYSGWSDADIIERPYRPNLARFCG